jgi:hypothetical protein
MALATKSKPTTTFHKKRQAGHHRQSKHYLKTYWPYLPMLVIVAVGLMINSLWSGQRQVLGTQSDFSSATLLASTDSDRTAAHKAPLTISPQLTAAAQAKANDMVQHNYWSHTSPAGRTPWSFITAAGYNYQVAGENLAYGFSGATQTVAGWMSSPEHRANILDTAYSNVGFGVAAASNFQGKGPATVVVAEYAAPTPSVANINFSVPNSPSATKGAATSQPAELAAQPVARVQVLTGGRATWTALAVGILAGAALAVLLLRHGWYWRRLVTRGELFITHHPILDIVAVLIVMSGFVLTRASGVIR